jgi:hypothetical protein
MVFPAELGAVARFFDENLPNRGYLVSSSTGSAQTWAIVFSKDDVDGGATLAPQSDTATLVSVEFTR